MAQTKKIGPDEDERVAKEMDIKYYLSQVTSKKEREREGVCVCAKCV